MEFLVRDCCNCGGWCCRCLSTGGTYTPMWISIEPEKVSQHNPWIPSKVKLENFQWASCTLVTSQGLCLDYSDRPHYCRSFPNLNLFLEEYLCGLAFFYCPWCYYRSTILQIKGIPFEFLSTGEECRLRYLEEFEKNRMLSKQFTGF